MFNSKYSKLLTSLLVVAIIAIIALLVYIGINWYKAYATDADTGNGLDQFDGYVNNIVTGSETNIIPNINTTDNVITPDNNTTIEPDIDVDNTIQNVTNNTGNSGSSSSTPTYKGFNMVGKIEIPAINVKYPVLERVTPQSIEASVAVLYGPGINKVGNTVIIGHNYRNGTFFSNNKKLVVGDKIYLTDLEGNRVTYIISKKYITGTDDAEYFTRETNGKRAVSLSTCTDDGKQRIIIWAEEA